MRHLGIGAIAALIMHAAAALAVSAELRFASLAVGASVYSNVVVSRVSALSADRVLVQHTTGIGTVRVSGLNAEVRQQLAVAGLISGTAAKDASRKDESIGNKLKSWVGSAGKSETIRSNVNEAQAEANSSFARRLETRIESEAWARGGASYDTNTVFSTLSFGTVRAICGGLLALYLFRCWCLFRICKHSTRRGSLLLFVPIFRWFPLVKAARMKRRLLLVPTFATVALCLPPPLPQVSWLVALHGFLVAVLWIATLLLFAIWCLRICAAVNCTPWIGILLFLPVLDWIALCYLAFSQATPELPLPAPVVADRPALAFEFS